jgi:DNA modification methylase
MTVYEETTLFNQQELLDIDIKSRDDIINILNNMLNIDDIGKIRYNLRKIKEMDEKNNLIDDYSNFKDDLEQIIDTYTIERIKYYIKRLLKSLLEVKTSKVNDLDLNKWKQYDDIITDSLWILEKRDNSGAHNADYWGNFIPQIPNQMFKRYTKKNEWILDTFLGSGTSLIECKRLGRNGIGIELQEKVVKIASENINNELNKFNMKTEIINGDSSEINYKQILENIGIKYVQFLIMHPPYWDIIKFSDSEKDLSNSADINEFLTKIGKIIDNTYSILEKGRYFAFVIGDKYSNGEWIPLGFYCMQEILKRKYKLKSIIVKNFEETKGKFNQKELWRYRALVGGFYIFKHEYIYLFQKD